MTLATHSRKAAVVVLLLIAHATSFGQSNPAPIAPWQSTSAEEDGANHLSFTFERFISPSSSSLPLNSAAAASEFNGIVRAIAQSNGEIYVGGDFTYIGDKPLNYIARWDGATWNQLGATLQIDGQVHAILVDGDKVYVGGTFTQAGSARTKNIAVWNRSNNSWSGFDGGVGGTLRSGVRAMAIHNGQLYVAGSFIAAGKIVAANIARWDGRRWHRVGTGINDNVRSLHIDGNHLYAGGEFTIAGDVRSHGIARYNLATERWENPGFDIEGSVTAIASDDRYVYIGGLFDSVRGQSVNNIVRIDKGTGAFSPMGKGVHGYPVGTGLREKKGIQTILVHDNNVYVGGTITQSLTQRSNGEHLIYFAGFAKWNGEYWSNMAYTSNPEIVPATNSLGPRKRQVLLAPPEVLSLASGSDGKILLGGDFDYIQTGRPESPYPYFGIYSPSDSTFASFSSGTAKKDEGTDVRSVVALPDEKMKSHLFAERSFSNRLLRSGFESPVSDDLPHTFPAAIAQVPDDDYWHAVESYVSNNYGVLAVAADETEVYAGGTFTHLYGIEANGIVVRRNKEWFPLDDGISVGIDGFVYAIAISGSKVYVGGRFSKAGGVAAKNIAVWDRQTRTWSALGGGVTGQGANPPFVSTILIRGDGIYVGGNFTTAGETATDNIARWNGNDWEPLGDGINGTVNALEYFRGRLYAGGSFTQAGDVVTNAIAYWDGGKWNGMKGGLNGFVNDIVVFPQEIGDTMIVAGGLFTRDILLNSADPPIPTHNLIWWNDSVWYAPGSLAGPEGAFVEINGEVRDLMMVGLDLYVAGSFTDAIPRGTGSAGDLLTNIAMFNYWIFEGQPIPMWHGLASGLKGAVNGLAISGEEIYAGGDFTRTARGDLSADHVALWDIPKQSWQWTGNPTALAPVEALALHKDILYATGSFVSQEIGLFDVDNYLVRLTENGWRIAGGQIRGTGYSLTSVADDELIMGGAMTSSNALITVNVSRWNSTTGDWSPLTPGSGVASLEDISFVGAVASDGDNVYVGGDFDIADTLSAHNVACWNRVTNRWTQLGDGLNGTVLALLVDENGTLYAGGSFNKSGNREMNHIARWDGTNWQPVGDGVDGNVFALNVYNGILYVGGAFRNAGSVAAINVAQWDIAAGRWSALGSGLDAEFVPAVYTLAVSKGTLFAGGKFELSGSRPIQNVARWNPFGTWEPLGSGTDRLINDMAIDRTGALYTGGHFLTAGTKEFPYVALWQDPILSVDDGSSLESGEILSVGAPNPFTTGTTISLRLPEGERSVVTLKLFDPTGREIRTLLESSLPSGDHTLSIDGTDLPSGVYFLRLQHGDAIESAKLIRW